MMKTSLITVLIFVFTEVCAAGDSLRVWKEMAAEALFRNPANSIHFAEKALKASGSVGDEKSMVENYELLAEASIRLFQPDQAFAFLLQAIEKASRNKMHAARIRCLILMGRLNWVLEDASKSLYYFTEAAKMASATGNFSLQLQAEALEAYQRIQLNPPGENTDFEKIRELFEFESAKTSDPATFARSANLMGNAVFLHKGDSELALKFFQQAILLCEEQGDAYMAGSYGQNMAEIHMNTGNIPAAEAILNKILISARQMKSEMLVYHCLKFLSICAAERLDFKKAYEMQSAYEELKSRHFSESQRLRTNKILEAYVQKKKEIQQIERENARLSGIIESEKKLRIYQIYLLGFLLSFLLLTILVLLIRRRLDQLKKQRQKAIDENEKLETLNKQLRQQKAEAEKSREISEAALKARAEFLSVITHEIRTPIHAVIAASHLLEDSVNSPKTRSTLEILRISAENLHSLINNVLDFNKIESGKIELEPRPFSLQDLLSGLHLIFLPQAEEKGIEFQFRVDQQLPPAFRGDRLRLGQILTNLISNAIKFTEKGFVEVEIRYQKKSAQSCMEICVRDSGIGLSEDEKAKIFDFFSQANAGISGRYGGSGLGLTISSRLLKLMGSELKLRTEPGKGSEFYFTLCLPETDIIFLRSGAHAPPNMNFSKYRLLFVEDVEYNRILAQRFFEKWQISFDFARSGQEAMKLADMNLYDLILMDIRLPDANGFDITTQIRAQTKNTDVPILAMSAFDRSEITHKLKECGIQDYLGKPFSPEDLRQALEKWLQKPALPEIL